MDDLTKNHPFEWTINQSRTLHEWLIDKHVHPNDHKVYGCVHYNVFVLR
ncbi:hypothetical protein HZA97_00070 [Candidatus Woesearchaeota archaeon]|nr:hypothetical protein [Candidatus Woesearchaeota archaeon]